MKGSVLLLAGLLSFFTNYGRAPITKPQLGINVGLNLANTQIGNGLPAGSLGLSNSVGFRLGLMANWHLIKGLSFAPKSELSFNNSSLSVTNADKKIDKYQIYPVTLEFGGHFTYKLLKGKAEPYLLFGPGYRIAFTDDKTLYAAKRNVMTLDFGIGLDKHFRLFDLAPELRYSIGFGNQAAISAVDNLNFQTISLVFNFKR